MKLTKLGVLVASAVLVFGACSGGGSSAAPSTGGGSAAAGSAAASSAAAGSAAAGSAPTDPLGVVTIQSADPIHLAFWGVLAGADASLGQDALYGVQVAVDDKGKKLLGHDIR